MASTASQGIRAQRRQRTEAGILAAARRRFAEVGFDRTTIRAIAAEAETDPAMVMRYFGSKEKLFRRVAELESPEPETRAGQDIAEMLTESLIAKLGTESSGTTAMLRSMLTHPEAGAGVRDAITRQQRQVAEEIPGDDAMLRAGLAGMVTLAAVIGRELLELEGVREADPERIAELLRPAIDSLVEGAASTLWDRRIR